MTEKIWSQFREELLIFIKSRLHDKSKAEDLLQEVFIKIHSSINTLSDDKKLISWIYQITRNTIIDYYRKFEKDNFAHEIDLDFPQDETRIKEDLICCLKPFIDKLPEKDRDAILKTSFGTLSQVDYAKQMNISYSTAKSRIQRAKVKLKKSFRKCCNVHSDSYGNIISSNSSNCDCN